MFRLHLPYVFTDISLHSVLEVDVGFICSCCLALPAFLDRHVPHGLSFYFGRFYTYFSGSKGQSDGAEDTKRLHPSSSRSANKYERMNREVDTPKRDDLERGEPQGSTAMSVRGGVDYPHGEAKPWQAGGIMKTVGIQHSYQPDTGSVHKHLRI